MSILVKNADDTPESLFKTFVNDRPAPATSWCSLVSSRARGVVSVLRPWAECLWEGGRCQVVWTKDTLAEVLEFVGFRVVLHEYYDSKGKFHMNKVYGLASARGGSCTTAPAPDPGSTPARVCAL